jgi:DNA polymerase III gamma/tau subunit
MSLYHKYRPTSFEDVIGNSEVIESLEGLLKKKERPHSFLLSGPTGCGKTTVARIIAKKLKSKGADYREVDSAEDRGISTIRLIINQSQFSPRQSKAIVWVLDECHKLTNDAQNALLKILEDTPRHVYFILCTTDPQKLIRPIKGRCSSFEMHPLAEKQMMLLLRKVVKGEGESLSKVVYEQIVDDCEGKPRNALQVLEQVLSADPDNRLEIAKKSLDNQRESIELCRALLEGAGWRRIADILNGLKQEDPEGIRRHVLGYCQAVLLSGKPNDKAAVIIEAFFEPFYNTNFAGLVFACYEATQ